jgi:ATP-binding cassette, subfamily G (WHITE), member 2
MSGLDSSSMLSLLASLRVQTESNVAVILTIHQPSSSVFYSFDWLLFLAGRGRVVYWGKPGDLMPYLAYYEFFPLYGPNSNPADFLMDLICQPILCYDGRTSFQFLIDIWDEYAPQPTNALTPADLVTNSLTAIPYTTSFVMQVWILMGRAWRLSKATIFSSWKIFEGVMLALVTGLLWYQTPYDESTVADKEGFFFFILASFFYSSVFSSVVNFPTERPVYIKETRAAQYSPAAYFIATTLTESPARLFLPLCYLTMSFSLVGINPNPRYAVGLIGSICLSGLVGEALGLLIGLLILDLQHSLVVANLCCITLMLLGGFYTENLPWFVDAVKYISPFYYTYQLCLQNDFYRPLPCVNGVSLPCCVYFDPYYQMYFIKEELTREELWEELGLTQRTIQTNLLILLLFFVTLKSAAYLALVHRKHNKTNE